jgi:hypothetical protein
MIKSSTASAKRRREMKTLRTLLSAVVILLGSMSVHAELARPGDREVIHRIEVVRRSWNQFSSALDKNLRHATLRGTEGEVKVDAYMADFETDLKRLRKRFSPRYSASAEMLSVTRRAQDVDSYFQDTSPLVKGRSEWDVFKASLNELAMAYGVTFPDTQSRSPRRINDAELEQLAATIAGQAERVRRGLRPAFGHDARGAKKADQAAQSVVVASRRFIARLKDNKPASGEAAVLRESVAQLDDVLNGVSLSGNAARAAEALEPALDKIEQGFAPVDG